MTCVWHIVGAAQWEKMGEEVGVWSAAPVCTAPLFNGLILRRRGDPGVTLDHRQLLWLWHWAAEKWHQAKYHIKRILEIINDIKLVDLTLHRVRGIRQINEKINWIYKLWSKTQKPISYVWQSGSPIKVLVGWVKWTNKNLFVWTRDKDFLSVIGGLLQCNTCQYLLAMKNTSQD